MTKSIGYKQAITDFYVDVPQHDASEKIKCEYVNFINREYMPTHFLTVRLPRHWETARLDYAKGHLRLIMKMFERNLIKNHWNKHHLPFIVVAEKGNSKYWHFHILFNQGEFYIYQLYDAIRKTIRKIKGMSYYCLNLKTIEEDDIRTFVDAVKNTDFYCLKEISVNRCNGKFDSDVLFDSVNLFYLNN